MSAQLPLSLYIHIPWCLRKCPYCDFNSHAAHGELPEADYVTALLADLADDLEPVQGRHLQSVFFGGGTPSLFSAPAIDQILRGVERHLSWAPDIEITLEANPGTAEFCNFGDLRAAGINRLSLGVQSFQSAQLAALGRIHNGQDALRAFALARQGGFTNINLDLMHGLPQQTPQDAAADLQHAIDLGPEHLSWYQLTIEPNTLFHQRPPQLPEDDLLADIQDLGETLLAANGYQHYEVSAYARAGQRSRHNLNYWQFGDYLGIGAGAHSKLTWPDGRIARRWKTRLPQDYLRRATSPLAGETWLDAEQVPLEFMLNALRLVDGVPSDLFAQRTGLPLSSIAAPLARARRRGLLAETADRLVATPLGQRFLNDLLAEFHPAT